MILEAIIGAAALLLVYLLIGLVITALVGGRDPLSFGPPFVIVAWPVVVSVIAIALMLMPSKSNLPEVTDRD